MNVSVLVPTLNEKRNITECLDSVRWASEVVVIDSGSLDGTVDIARDKGAVVIDFKWNRRYPKKKNWALENVSWKNEWVLIVDADERITPELAVEIEATMKAPLAVGYYINRRFMFLGQWIRRCGYYPSWNLRLFQHRKGRYEKLHSGDTGSGDNEVHEHVSLDGPTAYLKSDMLHFAYPDIYTWIEKHNRYSNWEAQVEVGRRNGEVEPPAIGSPFARRRAMREWSRRMPFRPTMRFLYSYILKRGFLDGRAGYVFCRLLASYELLNVFKAYELRCRPDILPGAFGGPGGR